MPRHRSPVNLLRQELRRGQPRQPPSRWSAHGPWWTRCAASTGGTGRRWCRGSASWPRRLLSVQRLADQGLQLQIPPQGVRCQVSAEINVPVVFRARLCRAMGLRWHQPHTHGAGSACHGPGAEHRPGGNAAKRPPIDRILFGSLAAPPSMPSRLDRNFSKAPLRSRQLLAVQGTARQDRRLLHCWPSPFSRTPHAQTPDRRPRSGPGRAGRIL